MSNMNTMPMSAKEGTKAKLDTFHPFVRFPVEIRCMIWGLSARDFQRGAHFFATSERTSESLKESCPTQATSIFDFHGDSGFDLTAPKAQDDADSVQDWVQGNPSAYVKDVGLWTTSWESRYIMTQRYQRLSKDVNIPSWSTDPFSSGQFTRNREEWHFKVSPSQDLFCIQPLNTEAPWCIMPFYRLPGSLSLTRFMNTALEYDPKWLDTSEPDGLVPYMEDSPRGCFIRTLWAVAEGKMHNGFQFWLIDRNIQKRDEPRNSYMPYAESDSDEEEKPEPLVFQGTGRRYVEVQDLSQCNWDALRQNTAFHFLHWLQINAGFGTGWMMRHRRPHEQSNPPLQFRDLDELVKVLCEEKL